MKIREILKEAQPGYYEKLVNKRLPKKKSEKLSERKNKGRCTGSQCIDRSWYGKCPGGNEPQSAGEFWKPFDYGGSGHGGRSCASCYATGYSGTERTSDSAAGADAAGITG